MALCVIAGILAELKRTSPGEVASSTDDFPDPPWQEDCRIPIDDDASQLPPDAET